MADALEGITVNTLWDEYVGAQRANILQTFAWGELKRTYGWQVERVVWKPGGEIAAAAQILYRRLAPALTIAYVPRGPVIAETQHTVEFLNLLKKHTRARGAFMLKLEPDSPARYDGEAMLRAAHASNTNETIQPATTIHLDLTAPTNEILARMKSKWRYNIRLSERKGVMVRAGSTDDFDAFYELMRLTGERDGFAIHGASYYRTAFELLDARGNVRLLIAEFENKPLAMIFVTAFADEAIYLYGASGNEERNRMPNHALHWAAILWAKERGCTRYDLWGIPDTVDETDEDSNLPSSLYQFKQGFGGAVGRYAGVWDIVYYPALYRVYRLARRMRKQGMA